MTGGNAYEEEINIGYDDAFCFFAYWMHEGRKYRPTQATTESTIVDTEKPTEVPTPTEIITNPTEAEDSKETPTPIPNPYVINGVDFKDYIQNQDYWIWDVTQNMTDSEPKFFVMQDIGTNTGKPGTPIAVLNDGDKYTLRYEAEKTNLGLILYTPKVCKEWKVECEDLTGMGDYEFYFDGEYFSENVTEYKLIPDMYSIRFKEMKDEPLIISLTYDDDTQETITVYLSYEG